MSHPARLPLIGLSPRLLHQVPAELGFRGKTLQYLEQSIAHWVMREGGLVLMIPTVLRGSPMARMPLDVADYVAVLDGLLLQGGADVDPAMYGEAPSPALGRVDPVRDRFELDLIQAFVAAGKPVLGICRGMQLINIAFGGSLHQDLQLAGVTELAHYQESAYDEHRHCLRFCADSWLGALHGDIAVAEINSIHHQAVNRLGDGLIVDAWSEDGVIEALHHVDGFVAGVQWHPEFHHRDPTLLDPGPLMRAFLDAALRRRDAAAPP